jgi:hypothetical protein
MLLCIPRDDRWCNMMLKSVQWFMQKFVQTGTAPMVNCNEAMPDYAKFMARTKERCVEVAKKVWVLPSVNNTTQELVWLGDGASDRLLPSV